jgi:hypothetical protein
MTPVRGEILLDRVLPQQAGNAEERSDRIGIAERRSASRQTRPSICAAACGHRHPAEGEGMGLAVVRDRVSLVADTPHHGGIGVGHLSRP